MLFAMLAQGLERAGTPVTGETLLAELMRVRTFQLAGGEVTFDEHASASSAIQISRVHGGRSEKIG